MPIQSRGRVDVRIAPNLLTRLGLEAIPICPQDITDLLHSHNRSIREWLEYFVINYYTTDFPELDSFLEEVEEFYPLTLETHLRLCREREANTMGCNASDNNGIIVGTRIIQTASGWNLGQEY